MNTVAQNTTKAAPSDARSGVICRHPLVGGGLRRPAKSSTKGKVAGSCGKLFSREDICTFDARGPPPRHSTTTEKLSGRFEFHALLGTTRSTEGGWHLVLRSTPHEFTSVAVFTMHAHSDLNIVPPVPTASKQALLTFGAAQPLRGTIRCCSARTDDCTECTAIVPPAHADPRSRGIKESEMTQKNVRTRGKSAVNQGSMDRDRSCDAESKAAVKGEMPG